MSPTNTKIWFLLLAAVALLCGGCESVQQARQTEMAESARMVDGIMATKSWGSNCTSRPPCDLPEKGGSRIGGRAGLKIRRRPQLTNTCLGTIAKMRSLRKKEREA